MLLSCNSKIKPAEQNDEREVKLWHMRISSERHAKTNSTRVSFCSSAPRPLSPLLLAARRVLPS